MGRIKPRTVSNLMDIANRFADGEDSCNNKRMRSPKDDKGNRYTSQRRRSRNYDNYGCHSQVAAGYKDNTYQGDDRRNLGYRNDNREDSSNNKKSSQEDQGSIINHQITCSMGNAIYTMHSLTTKECPGTQ
jgi:hypothetical protein